MTLYETLGGDQWKRSNGWMSDGPVGDWYGVATHGGRVVEIVLADNGLTGELPWQLGNLTYLTKLDLRWNAIEGAIPESFSELRRLKSLLLTDNALTGEIPWSLGRLAGLERLDLSYNQLTGGIPRELGELPSLQALGLHQNRLAGSIPWELSGVDTLQRLVVNGNDLTGPIPSEFFDMEELAHLNVEDNPLERPTDDLEAAHREGIDGLDALDESTQIIDDMVARVFIREVMGAINVRDGFLHLDARAVPASANPVEIMGHLVDMNQRLRWRELHLYPGTVTNLDI